jgi:hypothetical protein
MHGTENLKKKIVLCFKKAVIVAGVQLSYVKRIIEPMSEVLYVVVF